MKGRKRNVYRLLVGKPEGKRPLGGPTSRWADNIKMDLGEKGWRGGVVLTGLVWLNQDKWRTLMNVVMNHRVP
jgi:hypothetical protein